MDATKTRPSVTITTYSSSNSSYLRHPLGSQRQPQKREQDDGEHATKCEFSTNLFRNNMRHMTTTEGSGMNTGDRRSHQALLSDSARRHRGVLADLSQIRGPSGSVRGHKDVVRKSLEGIKVTYRNRFMNLSSPASSHSSSTSSASTNGGTSSLSTLFSSHSVSQRQGNAPAGQLSLTSFSANRPRPSTTSLSLLTIDNELYYSEYLERLAEDEQNLCVAYTTTLGVIRRTFEDSKKLRSILDLNLVKYEERDIYLNQEYKYQLKMRSGPNAVPALFVDGVHVGGAKELETMNENGELHKLLAKFKMSKAPKEICYCCGNAKFIACQSCNGSRKSTIHHFKFNSVALRCIKCDKNDGLVQCPVCSLQSAACVADNTAHETEPDLRVNDNNFESLSINEGGPKNDENLQLDLNNNDSVEC